MAQSKEGNCRKKNLKRNRNIVIMKRRKRIEHHYREWILNSTQTGLPCPMLPFLTFLHDSPDVVKNVDLHPFLDSLLSLLVHKFIEFKMLRFTERALKMQLILNKFSVGMFTRLLQVWVASFLFFPLLTELVCLLQTAQASFHWTWRHKFSKYEPTFG